MDISLLSTTRDPEQLRTLAIAMVQKVMAENAELQNRIRILEEQMKLARQQRFGKKCESLAGMQRSLFEEDVDADIAEISAHLDKLLPQSGDEEKTTTRPVRKPLPSHLPRIEKVIPPAEARCPECDEALHFIRNEVSEKMEYIPAQVVVHRYVRPQYSCPCCEKVFSGKMPAHVLPKSAVEPSVIAQVVISKYTDHLPLYRQQHIFSRMGVELPVSTMADMVGVAGAALAPLAKLLRLELLTRDVIHADETSLRLLDTRKGGKSCSGWLWAYVSGERSGPPVVCFDSQPGRALRYPEAWLQGWRGGTLVSDGYNVYKSLADNHPGITSACCWSHARRGFANLYKASREPRAAMALKKIAGLYRIEKLIRNRPVEKIRQWRQRYSRPIVNDLFPRHAHGVAKGTEDDFRMAGNLHAGVDSAHRQYAHRATRTVDKLNVFRQ